MNTITTVQDAKTALILGIIGLVLRIAILISLFIIGQWILGLLLLLSHGLVDHADKTLNPKQPPQ